MMENKILFAERQKFKQWWLWLLLLGINGMFLFGIFKKTIGSKVSADNAILNNPLIIGFVVILLVTILFLVIKLETIVKEDGIYVRFFPFQIAYRKYVWEKIDKAFVREYSPIGEYGGWGFRYGTGNGKALNISGNKGLQLIFTNNTRLLIGTNKMEDLEYTLNQISQIKQ